MSNPSNPEAPPTSEEILNLAQEILRQILSSFGFREDEKGDGLQTPDLVEHDYSIAVFEHGYTITIDIDVEAAVRGVLIGHEAKTLEALNTLLAAALGQRLNHRRFGRLIQVTIRGYQPPPFRVRARREDRRGDARQ